MAQRSEHFHLILSTEEKKILRTLAERRGVRPSDEIRLLLREEHDRSKTRSKRAT